ncbi:siderophore-interacting protein, partial [Mycolicibacterium austroafricanum]
MHGDGVGTAWASRAAEGDKVVLAHANSWYRPPATTDWQLLVADMAGLPALAAILDDPPPVPTTVFVEVVDDDALAYLPTQPDVTVVPSFDGALPQRVSAYTPPE